MKCPVCAKEFDTMQQSWNCPHCHSNGTGIYITNEYRAHLPKKEDTTMQVSCNGFTGELVKLERVGPFYGDYPYSLSIYDSEKQVTHSFTGVKLEDVKFLGGAMSFGG